MFKRSFAATLIAILVLLGAVVINSSAQERQVDDPEWDALMAEAYKDLQVNAELGLDVKFPIMMNQAGAQGIFLVETPAGEYEAEDGSIVKVDEETAALSQKAQQEQVFRLVEVDEWLGAIVEQNPGTEVGNRAVLARNSVQQIRELVEGTPVLIRDIRAGVIVPPTIYPWHPWNIQILNPNFFSWWWAPPPSKPGDIEETAFTAEIPMWGSAIIVKEVKGLKLEVLFRPIPFNPCWWRRLGIRPWRWLWHIRLVPAEFVKTITYVNTWDAQKRQPKIVKTWDTEIIPEYDLVKFWRFLAGANTAPSKEGENPLTTSKATTWGNLKRIR
jgi:hypothetical protein